MFLKKTGVALLGVALLLTACSRPMEAPEPAAGTGAGNAQTADHDGHSGEGTQQGDKQSGGNGQGASASTSDNKSAEQPADKSSGEPAVETVDFPRLDMIVLEYADGSGGFMIYQRDSHRDEWFPIRKEQTLQIHVTGPVTRAELIYMPTGSGDSKPATIIPERSIKDGVVEIPFRDLGLGYGYVLVYNKDKAVRSLSFNFIPEDQMGEEHHWGL